MDMSDVDPQEFGEMKGQVASIAKTLEKHLSDCYESNKQVASNLNRLALATGVLALAVFGSETFVGVLLKVFG